MKAKTKTMILNWKQSNLFSVSFSGGKEFLKILPGNNTINDEVWSKISTHPLIQIHLTEENLVVVEKSSKPDKPGLLGYTKAKAKKLISGTFDKQLLADWKSVETRDDVISEIFLQEVSIDQKTKKPPETVEEPF